MILDNQATLDEHHIGITELGDIFGPRIVVELDSGEVVKWWSFKLQTSLYVIASERFVETTMYPKQQNKSATTCCENNTNYGIAERSDLNCRCTRFIVLLLFQASTLLMHIHHTTNNRPNAMLQPILSVANHTNTPKVFFRPLLSVSHSCRAPRMTCIALNATLNSAKMKSTTGKNRWKYAV